MRATSSIALAGIAAALAFAALAWRMWGTTAALVLFLGGCVLAIALGAWRARRFDIAWAAARLDAARRDLDDSAHLLSRPQASLSPLQRLQQSRVQQRLRDRPAPDLRPAWSWHLIVPAWALAVLVVAWALAWPAATIVPSTATQASRATAAVGPPALQTATLNIAPPAYTGIAASRTDSLDAQAPVGSRLQWRLRFDPQPEGVVLRTHEDRDIPLRREEGDWLAETVLDASMLYRVVVQGDAAVASLHRIDARPDQPPRVRVRQPERALTLADPLPRAWAVAFEAEDDHGLAIDARLLVTRTEGTGENIRFIEHDMALRGRGDRRQLRFETTLDPARYGVQRGEDLIVRLEVRDNRAPQPQVARSASAILRWPERTPLGAEGLDGLARQILPAYFRSQRQIIIDAEALIAERPRLTDDAFLARSDTIGVDQRLLRLRYGQFLGEESEGAPSLPTSDLPTSDLDPDSLPGSPHAHDDGQDHSDHAHGPGDGHGHDHDDHDHAVPAPTDGFGDGSGVVEAFGHIHDLPEAATLLDPKTREILRGALREMWQSELHLRQGAPRDALPYANRALELIKQVQQADRIYLPRVGSQLPPVDESRRLGGKRDGIASRALPAPPARDTDPVLAAWRGLETGATPDVAALDALQAWAATHPARVRDPLALVAAIDALRIDPACRSCLDALRAVLWAAMQRPAAGIAPRDAAGASGRRYLDALQAGEGAQ
ncbi:hypothetical protein E2F46_07600 [Luteimonas aestuarii]|uniref:DUF4175 family protein n=2 Tax=Luteimonas aestuarii TaxID=453837 RepID=A0A4R5TVL7_9GAMM|nr:hypothetical protein E2F46_07600 [Luteimonas aestuarii]